MTIETDDNDFKGVFGNRQLGNPLNVNVLLTCAGRCGHETMLEHVIT